MQIVVKESLQGKYGPQLKDDAGYLSFGKFYKGDTAFAPGTILEVEVYVSPKGSRYINELKVKSAKTEGQAIPKIEVETAKVTKQEHKVAEKKAVAFGRELSEYELAKDRRIGVAGVVQAVIGSEWYAQQAALTDLSSKESVDALRKFAIEEVDYWLNVIKGKSE